MMNNKVIVAYIILTLPFNQEFLYKIPNKSTVQIGSIVKVYFAKKKRIGIITNIKTINASILDFNLKEIYIIYNFFLVNSKILDFIKWVSRYNVTCYGNIVKMLLLHKQNIDYVIQRINYKKFKNQIKKNKKNLLSDIQLKLVSKIDKVGFLKFSVHLILGETGSGKTEIYLSSIYKIINNNINNYNNNNNNNNINNYNNNNQILILIPEILLVTQLIKRLKNELNHCTIAEWSSSLTSKIKSAIWRGVLDGNIDVIVGARSALFLPFQNLRIIIIDEENDGAFKQEDSIIYNARDMSVIKASIEEIPIILVTATPSIESYYNVILNKYRIHRLPNRYTGVSLPQVKIVDLKKQNNKWISRHLKKELFKCLEKKKFAMLFLNRRGYFSITMCGDCREQFLCPNCDFSLVEYKKSGKLLCHYCGYMQKLLIRCKKCRSSQKLLTLAPGIEKIEEEISLLFPSASIAVVTSDSLITFGKTRKIVNNIHNKEYDIIIGTQILAKGLNFLDLHLVGVLDICFSSTGTDLKILEKTFQLLYQVAGRAGRYHDRGLVLTQTYHTSNPFIVYVQNWKYESFIKNELKNKKKLLMPPFSKLLIIKCSGINESFLYEFMHYISSYTPICCNVKILGPSPLLVYKMKNKFRYKIILKILKQINIEKYLYDWFSKFTLPISIKMKIDIDPYNSL